MVTIQGILMVASIFASGACAVAMDRQMRQGPDRVDKKHWVFFLLSGAGFVGFFIGGFIYQQHLYSLFHGWTDVCSGLMILMTVLGCAPALETITSPKWHNAWR